MMMQERIEKLTMDWFLIEPALLKVLMMHNVAENVYMQCPVRCGGRRIEYNPALCQEMTDDEFAETMRTECIRILLKHPYERQPDNCSAIAVTQGSNCVVADNYQMIVISLQSPKDFNLESGQHFEYYAKEIQKQQQGESDDGQSNDQQGLGLALEEQSALWKEDQMAVAEVNEMIHVLESTRQWGSLSDSLIGQIIASSRARIDYRRILQLFRTEVLSSKRRRTRMRPNRRSGFQSFGSVYQLTSRLLVAVDVSGSASDAMVSDFFGVINKFFKYGIEDIDVIQFDAFIHGEPMPMKKAKKGGINIIGRGGTNFQVVFDYVAEQKGKYQGLIIFTDGYASKPQLPEYFHTPVLWVLPCKDLYNVHKSWMQELGKACFIELNS